MSFNFNGANIMTRRTVWVVWTRALETTRCRPRSVRSTPSPARVGRNSKKGRSAALIIAVGLCVVTKAGWTLADESAPARWYERPFQRVETTWREGTPELYLPLHTTHLRFAYSRDKIEKYNESPWGIGLGKGMYAEDGDWHGLYVMGFKDSNFKPQYVAGYGYRTFWNPVGNLKLGIGYNAFITARSDIRHYAPIPVVLPVVSLGYKKLTIDTAYVPGVAGKGNVLFFFGRMTL